MLLSSHPATAAPPALPLVLQGRLDAKSLAGQVVLVTGAGGGVGLEAARSLLQLGASVVVAELDAGRCAGAAQQLAAQAGKDGVMIVAADVSDEDSVRRLVESVLGRYGKIDAVVNNATFAPAGSSVVETATEDWDRSYAVNLRGPMLLARQCLPGMLARRHGVFACVSSTGGPFLAPYETLKAAQVALANSLDAELADTGVVAFTIGPGLVPTSTAVAAIERIGPRLGMTVEQFWRTNEGAVVSVEAAGAGFAAAVAMADRYAGQEISSTQALIDAGISLADSSGPPVAGDSGAVAAACAPVLATLRGQAQEWSRRSFFERQWMLRDFKQRVGIPVERAIELVDAVSTGDRSAGQAPTLERLAGFYRHMGELAAGYVKDPPERQKQVAMTAGWAVEVDALVAALTMNR
jgi:NAD(P)-dependent dehydrogenase (short-subunit alcohol dehydrogenase family)